MRRAILLFLCISVVSFSAQAEAKNCKKGKPCGDACIPVDHECHVGSGGGSWQPTPAPTPAKKTATKKPSAAKKAAVDAGQPVPYIVPQTTSSGCEETSCTGPCVGIFGAIGVMAILLRKAKNKAKRALR